MEDIIDVLILLLYYLANQKAVRIRPYMCRIGLEGGATARGNEDNGCGSTFHCYEKKIRKEPILPPMLTAQPSMIRLWY